jgi:hypothetical protein
MYKRNQVLLAALAATFAPLGTSAAMLCVNPGGASGCHATIAAAVANALPGDTIAIAAGTYNETDIDLDKPLTIVGAGAGATIVDGKVGGTNAGIVFRFRQNATPFTLSDLTVQGGRRGIDLGGGNTVTLARLHVTGNGPETGAGISNGSSVMHLRDSLVDFNSATDLGSVGGCDWGGGSGGGIASLCGGGNNFISGSTIANNVAARWGGGLIVNDGHTVIENSTISGNEANFPDAGLGGGALFVGGAFPVVEIRFSTIANNRALGSGGILGASSGRVEAYATLFQGNAGNACTGGVTSLGYNMSSDASCGFSQVGDANSTDAKLAPLADLDGPTPMHALRATSPAVDRIPASACTATVDQDGVARPQHHACDVGAYEHVWSAKDLTALLISQLTGTSAGNSHVSQVSAILAMIAEKRPRAACLVLRMVEQNIAFQAQRGKVPQDKADAILRTIDDLQGAIGC